VKPCLGGGGGDDNADAPRRRIPVIAHANVSMQRSPIFSHHQDAVVEALRRNTVLQFCRVDFQTATCTMAVQDMVHRNKSSSNGSSSTSINYGERLLQVLEEQVRQGEMRQKARKEGVLAQEVTATDMPFLYELYERASKYRLPYDTSSTLDEDKDNTTKSTTENRATKTPIKLGTKFSLATIASSILTADGSFLTADFISKYLQKSDVDGRWTLNFDGQMKVFQRFSITDPARACIAAKFVNALVCHPQSVHITHIYHGQHPAGE
jgi:hypothetical protein